MQGVEEWLEAGGDREEKLMRAAITVARFMLANGYGHKDPAFFDDVGKLEKRLGCDESDECDSGYGGKETTPSPEQVTKPTTTTGSTQTSPPPAMRDAATEPTEPTPELTLKTYAEVAVQVSTTSSSSALRREGKGKAKAEEAPVPAHMKAAQAPTPPKAQNTPPPARLLQTNAIMMHAAPLHYKPGAMRRWIEEDNQDVGVEILGIRWLLKENRPGKVASSLVIYMKSARKVEKLRMGSRFFRTTSYDWDRISTRTCERAMSPTRSTTSTESLERCERYGL